MSVGSVCEPTSIKAEFTRDEPTASSVTVTDVARWIVPVAFVFGSPIADVSAPYSSDRLHIEPIASCVLAEVVQLATAWDEQRTREMAQIIGILNLFATYAYGWDDEDGLPPAPQDIEHAKNLLRKMPAGIALPRPMLDGTGRVGLFWNEEKSFAEIEIEPEGLFTLYTRDKTGARSDVLLEGESIANVDAAWFRENLSLLIRG